MKVAESVGPIFGLATPVGRSGVAVIRLSGPGLVPLVVPCLLSPHGRPLVATTLTPRHLVLCQWVGPGREWVVDQLMVVTFPAPHSYTGEEMMELHCHGSLAVIRQLLQDLVVLGLRPAVAGEFSRRAFANGKMDLLQAEAMVQLIAAAESWAMREAVRQMRGSFSRVLQAEQSALLSILAHLAASLDFADEEIEPHGRESMLALLGRRLEICQGLLDTADYGRHLREGCELAIIGRPNVGKSSLFNRLAGKPRAIVTDQPGTTRDLLEYRLALDGLTIHLVDSAGIRASLDPVEQVGIGLARDKMQEADGILLVVDVVTGLTGDEEEWLAALGKEARVWVVLNQIDRAAHAVVERVVAAVQARGIERYSRVSCLTGEGVETLVASLPEWIRSRYPQGEGEVILMAARQQEVLVRTREALVQAIALTKSDRPAELIAFQVNQAMNTLGELVGTVATERLLDVVFGSFCLGK